MSHKIAMIGAGSVVFSKNLTGDLLQYPEFADATFSYMDIDAQRLDVGAALCGKVAKKLGVSPTIEKTQDRQAALRDADFVVCMVQVGGFNSTLVDFEIPRKYGLNFTIADTTGPGGLFRALRTFPFMRDLGRDIVELSRDTAWLLQYSNPMSMNMRALYESTDYAINAVGLCHSVQGTIAHRMRDIDVPMDDINFVANGINHMCFYTRIERAGEDLYPKLFAIADQKIERGEDAVRYELMKRLGYAITESSEHNAEYCAHFMPHEGMVDKFGVPIDEYLRRCDGIVDEFDRLISFSKTDEPIDVHKSHEYGSVIAHSIVTGEPSVVYGNLPNNGAIPNLPDTAIVETPTLVDRNGCQLTRVDPLPPQLMNYVMPHVTQHELFIKAATEGRRDAVYQAAIADPLTAATVPMDKIVEMCDELIAGHGMEKDGGTLPDLDAKKTLVPSSGKTFGRADEAALRSSWDAAKMHTSDEDVVDAWHLAGPFAKDDDMPAQLAERYLSDGKIDVTGNGVAWKPGQMDDADHVVPSKSLGAHVDGAVVGYAEYESVHDRETTMRVQSPRWHKIHVHVNGEKVFEGDGDETVPVRLVQGYNRVLVKMDRHGPFSCYVEKANF